MKSILVTGACGFIGSHAVRRFASDGWNVTGLDNLSRLGATANRDWLLGVDDLRLLEADVTDLPYVERLVGEGGFDVVLHLAGQTAVTTSVAKPADDLRVNVGGTFNMLDCVRRLSPATIFINASTNKVYGALPGTNGRESERRFDIASGHGFDEHTPLDFHSPYGCSKGAADQYVLDYARVYGLRAVSARQSCIYGPWQWGVEDQGWLAWFLIAHLSRQPITIFGSGKQTRDILFVDDLIDFYLQCIERIDGAAGLAFNVGGGPANTLSLLELLEMFPGLSGRAAEWTHREERPGDQQLYVSDIRRAQDVLGWAPRVGPSEGVTRLYEWIAASLPQIEAVLVQRSRQ